MPKGKSVARSRRLYVAAFAIEDKVEFTIEDDAPTAGRTPVDWPGYSKAIATNEPNYFVAVRRYLEEALTELYLAARHRGGKIEALKLFMGIDLLCISCRGVIRDNRVLVQIPLWSWDTNGKVLWSWGGEQRDEFDFPREIYAILYDIAVNNRHGEFRRFLEKRNPMILGRSTDGSTPLERNVIVVNDVAACAAAEHTQTRKRAVASKSAGHVVLVKVHEGINIGAINEGYEGGTPHNAEMGHFYPNRHAIDDLLGYEGMCPFHDDCLEGLICAPSLLERAKRVTADHPDLGPWRRFIDEYSGGRDIGDALCAHLLGSGDHDAVAVDLVAHYVAQLVHQIVLYPVAPEAIVLSGRLASSRVVGAVQSKLIGKIRGYPRREELLPSKIQHYVRKSIDPFGGPGGGMELAGAIAIARRWRTLRRPTRPYGLTVVRN